MELAGYIALMIIAVGVFKLVTATTYRENVEQKYSVARYDPYSGDFLDEKEIYLYQQVVREWFELYESDPAQDNYIVDATIRNKILKITNTDIDLNKYNYNLEYRE